MGENLLERVPAQTVLARGRLLTQLAREHFTPDVFPKLHVGSHFLAPPAKRDQIGTDAPIFPNHRTARLCAAKFNRRDTPPRPPPPL